MPRVDASRRVYTACLERLDAIDQGKRTLESALASVRPPSWAAFAVFISILLFGIASLALMAYEYAAAALGLVSAAALFWYRDRVRRTKVLGRQLVESTTKLDLCKKELRTTESEARDIENEIRKLTGKTDIAQSDINQRLAFVEELSRLIEEARSLDEASARGRN